MEDKICESQDNQSLAQLGLDLKVADVEVGKTYWIYGWITKFLSEEPDNLIVELNFSIKAHISVQTPEKVELLKGRAFEAGMFVCTILSKEDAILADCHTVVFGKRNNMMV